MSKVQRRTLASRADRLPTGVARDAMDAKRS